MLDDPATTHPRVRRTIMVFVLTPNPAADCGSWSLTAQTFIVIWENGTIDYGVRSAACCVHTIVLETVC